MINDIEKPCIIPLGCLRWIREKNGSLSWDTTDFALSLSYASNIDEEGLEDYGTSYFEDEDVEERVYSQGKEVFAVNKLVSSLLKCSF